MSDYVLRWLIREEWKPSAGRSVIVFNALSGSNTIPEDGEWDVTEGLPGHGEVSGEIIGLAHIESGARLPNVDTFDEFHETVKERGEVLQWQNGWDPQGEEDDEDDNESEDGDVKALPALRDGDDIE